MTLLGDCGPGESVVDPSLAGLGSLGVIEVARRRVWRQTWGAAYPVRIGRKVLASFVRDCTLISCIGWTDRDVGGRRMREAESVPGSAPVALARYVPLSRLRPRELGHRARMSGQCGLCRLDGHEAAIAREVGCERDL